MLISVRKAHLIQFIPGSPPLLRVHPIFPKFHLCRGALFNACLWGLRGWEIIRIKTWLNYCIVGPRRQWDLISTGKCFMAEQRDSPGLLSISVSKQQSTSAWHILIGLKCWWMNMPICILYNDVIGEKSKAVISHNAVKTEYKRA